MASVVTRCLEQGWIDPPRWVKHNIMLEVVTGSVSYGMSNDMSDMDIVSVVMPPKDDIFPYSHGGHIFRFGEQPQPFNIYQKHHIKDADKHREYDITLYSIVRFFDLCLAGNPNLTDVLFTPRRCVLHSSELGERILANRKLFLSKKAFHKYIGYAHSQMTKIKTKESPTNSKRKELVERFGFDTKYAAHLVRLMLQIRQIMIEGDLDLERNTAILKAVRDGEWTLERVVEWFANTENDLNTIYATSTLREFPAESDVRQLLLDILEIHYGDLSAAVKREVTVDEIMKDLATIVEKYRAR